MFSSCKDTTAPQQVDWRIFFWNSVPILGKTNSYKFTAEWYGTDTNVQQSDNYALSLNSQDIPLVTESTYHSWQLKAPSVQLDAGATYNMVFSRNGEEICSTEVTIPCTPTITFPQSFNPTETNNISWSLLSNSHAQYVYVCAESNPESKSIYYLDWIDLLASDRSFSLPANTVIPQGQNDSFSFGLQQENSFDTKKATIRAAQTTVIYY